MARYREEGRESSYLSLLRLLQLLSFSLVFAAGLVLGLLASPHINNIFSSHSHVLVTSNLTVTTISAAGSGGINSTSNVDRCNCSGYVEAACKCKPCAKKPDSLSMETFLHPKSMNHKMGDEEVFWRASLMPYKKEFPYDRVPKIAFMFLTRGRLPLLPLWERFFKGHDQYFNIYVHASPDYALNVTKDSVFYRRQIPSRNVEWGTALLVDAERRLLANALLDFSNERFLLLSESCIPLYNFPTIYKYIVESELGFVEMYDEPSRQGRGRYSRKMHPTIKLFQWRKGSQWFEMQRSLAVRVVSDTKYHPLFEKYCKPACYPDEHYIPTMVNMLYGSLNSNRTLTWVNWSLGGPHPATYTGRNITEGFIQSIRNSGTRCAYNQRKESVCHLFARKFDASALQPLLNISSSVLKF